MDLRFFTKLFQTDMIGILLRLSTGVKNIFLYLLNIDNVPLPYIPVPGVRQILRFFEGDPVLKVKYLDILRDPEGFDELKTIFYDLNYCGNIAYLKGKYPELSRDIILKRALENTDEFGLIAMDLEKYIAKLKHSERIKLIRIIELFRELYDNGKEVKGLWESIDIYS